MLPLPFCRSTRARQRGDLRVAAAIILLLLAGGGALTWAWWQRTQAENVVTEPVASGAIVRAAAQPAAPRTIEQLLEEARAAVSARELVAPAGRSAFDRYLAVLAAQPANAVASDALRELFPFAAEQVGATLRAGQLDEAQRQLDLLARADPDNYTLTLLRGQLAEQQRAVAAAVPAAAATRAPVLSASESPITRPTPAPQQEPTRPAMAAAGVASPTLPAPAVAARAQLDVPSSAPTTAPVLQRRVEPYYPQGARRSRREGWVEVTFTVQPDGHVDGVRVLQSMPGRVFDKAATSAVQRWVFAPATRNGQPVAASLRQRLDFRL